MRSGLWLVVASACACAGAETVSVNAAAGAAKTDYKVRTGATAVEVNAAATAGTVRLNAANVHTGGTTLKGGTLDVRTAADGDLPADTGTGSLVLKGGNFRYAGPAGAEWKTPVSNEAPDSSAVNWQVENDLVVSGSVGSPSGVFVKTGAGTLTLAAPFVLSGQASAVNDTNIRKQMADLSPDHAPTKGVSNVTFLEGTTVIDPGYALGATAPTTNVLASAGWTQIGGYTTEDGQEKGAVLEQRSGVTYTAASLNIGANNGKVGQSGEPPVSGLRLTGGRFLVGKTGTSPTYMGAKTAGGTNRGNSFLDISSNNRFVTKGFYPCQDAGTVCDVHVHDGGYLYALDANYQTGGNTSSAATTNNLVVEGEGTWISFQNFNNDSKNGGLTTNIRLADGAVMEMRNFINSSKGTLNLVFDGGIWRHRNHNSVGPHWPSSITSAKIGPGGLIVYHNDGSPLYPVIWDKGLEPLDDSGTDGGVSFTQGAANPPCLIRAVNTYRGPTVIEKIQVQLGGAGRLPTTTDLRISTNGGGLVVSNGVQTVRSLHFGTAALNGAGTSPMLGFTPGSRLDVTESVVAGPLNAPKLWLFEQAGPTNMLVNGLVSRGVHTFVTAPKACAGALADIAARLTFPYKPDTVDYAAFVAENGDRAELRVEVVDAGSAPTVNGGLLVLPTTDGDPTLSPTAEQVAAAETIVANPRQTGAGSVDLGALAGFAAGGTLRTGSGRTAVSDLSFVRDPSDLVLGGGTLAYTGSSATIPGLSVNAGAYSGVLDIVDEGTTLTLSAVGAQSGGLTKMGPGTLHLAGSNPIELTRNAKDNGNGNGVAANGDSPTSGYRAVNVNGGVLSIGTVDDPSDAPDVLAPYDLSVGSQSHRAGLGVQTAGELQMNNGSLFISNVCFVGYYNACDTAFTGKTYPSIVQNGGYMREGSVRLYQDGNTTKTSKACPKFILHGGTNDVNSTFLAGYQACPSDFDGRATILIDGGLVRVGSYFANGYANGTLGVDCTITGEGRVEAQGAFYPNYANKKATNIIRLQNGGTLRSLGIDGRDATNPVEVYFDGGVFEPLVDLSANSQIVNLQKAYLGAGGLVCDLSHEADLMGPTTYWLNLRQKFESDPALGGAADGGIVLRGAGTAISWDGFEDSTFTGGIRVEAGARFVACKACTPPDCTVTVEPGATFSSYAHSTPTKVGSLLLGAAGAAEPTYLELLPVASLGAAVTGSLAVDSPVAVRTRADNHVLETGFVQGVYTALVYNASNADVDLSKFVLPSDAPAGLRLDVRQETLAAGDYAGYKAVVVTIGGVSAASATWISAAAGGNWTDSANWQGGAVAPNAPGAVASFVTATQAGVPVALDVPVALGGMQFAASSGKNGYTLSGSTLTLGADGLAVSVESLGGTNTVASPTTVAGTVRVRSAKGGEVRLASVTGTGDLELNENNLGTEGQVTAHLEPDYAGSVKTGAGRVALDSLAFAQRADQLTLGAGTLLYTGAESVQVGGIQVSAGSGRTAILENTADIVADALTVSGTSAFMKRGTGELRVHGTSAFKPNTSVSNSSDNKVQANGDSPNKGIRGFTVATGRVAWGEKDDASNAPVYSSSACEITVGGATSQGDATLEVNNGSVTDTGTIYLGYYGLSLTPRATFSLVLNGGTYQSKNITCAYNWTSAVNFNTEVVVNDGATGYVTGDVILNRCPASKPAEQFCRWTQHGGVFGVKGNFHTSYWMTNQSARGIVDLNGGRLCVTGAVYFARAGKNTQNNEVRFSLNDGARLEVNAITQTVAAAKTCFYGNGGTLVPIGATAAGGCFGAVGRLFATTNGLVVDTSVLYAKGKDYLVALPIEHDPDAPAVDGGVVKRGAGLLRLAGANTFTGPLALEGGTVRLEGTAGTAVNALAFAGGTLDAVAPLTAGTVSGAGLCQGSLMVTSVLAPALDAVVTVTGDFTLAAGAKVDLSALPAGSLAFGDMVPLVAVEGTVDVPAALSVTDASAVVHVSGQKFRLRTELVDGVLYGTPVSGGTVLVFR